MDAASSDGDVRISAVIPTHNRGHLVGRAIASVLHQERLPSEILVVDDGSTDGTAEVVASFGEGVRYFYQPNAGASAARNLGVAQAASEWIAFLDSDDVWLEQHLKRMAEAILATGGAANYYFSDMIMATPEGERSLWEMLGFQIEGKVELKPDGREWAMRRWPPMMLQSSVFSRSAYQQAGGLWERLRTRHDSHLFVKLGLGGPICAVAGFGARMTADAQPDGRLTSGLDGTADGARQLLLMYQNLLQTVPGLSRQDYRELKRRLAGNHRRLAKYGWRDRHPWATAWHLLQSARLDPGFFWRRLDKSVSAAEQGGAGWAR